MQLSVTCHACHCLFSLKQTSSIKLLNVLSVCIIRSPELYCRTLTRLSIKKYKLGSDTEWE